MYIRTFFFGLLITLQASANQSLPETQVMQKLLQDNLLPGISVAVVDNYQVVANYAGGKRQNNTNDNVTQSTSFNAASISKPVVATLALMLAEQARLDLDVPVGHYLKSWTLPTSNFSQKISLRHLLSHTSGTTQGGYSSRYLGETIPSTIETLESYKQQKISTLFAPGKGWKYSGGGFLIAQLVLQDVTGKSLAQLANEMLFQPLAMSNSTFYQDGDQDFPFDLAKAHDHKQQVIKTGMPICPQAACGLWTNASDMAKFAIEIQKALSKQGTKVISNQVARQLVEVQTTRLSGAWGLGWARNLAQGNLDWFSHSGYNHGTGGLVMASTTGGRGIFMFANGEYRARIPVFEHIVADVIQRLGWKQPIQGNKEKPSPQLLKSIVGQYQNLTPHHFSPFAKQVTIKQQGDSLILLNGETQAFDLIHMGDNKFRANELVNSLLGFKFAENGDIYVTLEHKNLSSDALLRLTTD